MIYPESEQPTAEAFDRSMELISALPSDGYFLYGSSALDIETGIPESGVVKPRIIGLDPAIDIDMVLVGEGIEWDQTIDLAHQIHEGSDGKIILDVHQLGCTDAGMAIINDNLVPLEWLTTSQIGKHEVSVLDPVPALMIRFLFGRIRVKDPRRMLAELRLVDENIFHDERFQFAMEVFIQKCKADPKLGAQNVAKMLAGLLPVPLHTMLSEKFRHRGGRDHWLLEESYPRQVPVRL